jgi:3',5'-cyclic AMP phosphodiesterase CpdA
MAKVLRVAQLSDTHFLERGADPEGGHAYDTSEAFDAVLDHLSSREVDLVVVTGDIADHGRDEQYEIAAAAFARLPCPVFVCPGNHDADSSFRAAFQAPNAFVPRVTHHGPWSFVYADSNAGAMDTGDSGRLLDPPGEDRLHGNGSLGTAESAWVRAATAGHDADHVFVWVHHPPDADVPLANDPVYTAEWEAVVADRPKIRGFGGGHTHIPSVYEFAGRPVFVAPSLKNNFDLLASTWLPPGYRSYEFGIDGTVTSDVHLVDDDERWPRRPFGRAIRSLFMGEISHSELAEIVARRAP